LLLVQAGREDRFSRDQARLIERAAGPGAESWLVEDAGHNHAWEVHRAEYERRVRDFFRRALAPGARAGAAGKAVAA